MPQDVILVFILSHILQKLRSIIAKLTERLNFEKMCGLTETTSYVVG